MADAKPLAGQVALVAGATRGAGRGIATMLGAAGAVVYCSGRSTRDHAATPDVSRKRSRRPPSGSPPLAGPGSPCAPTIRERT